MVEVRGEQDTPRGGTPRGATAAGAAGAGAALLVLLAGIVVCRLWVLVSDWGYDTGAWMYMSRRMVEGGRPYVDVWDNKLPPLYWIGMLYWVSGVPRLAMFVAEVALTTLSALMLAGIVRRAGVARPWALVLGALFVCAAMPAWEYAHRLESYALAPLAVGLWLVVRATLERDTARPGAFFAAGVLVALAVTLRAQHVLDALVLGLWIPLAAGEGARWRRLAAYAGGGVLLTGLFLAFVAWRGYLPQMLQDGVLGGAGYAAGEAGKVPHSLGRLVWALRTNVDLLPVMFATLGVALALILASWRRAGGELRALCGLGLALCAVQLAATFVAGHQIIHYYFPLGWTAALLLGLALAASGLRSESAAARTGWLPAATAVVLFVATALPVARVFNGARMLVRGRPESRGERLERLVRENVPPDGPIYLLDDYSTAGALARLPNPPATPQVLLAMQARFGDPADPPPGTSPYGMTTLGWGRQIRAEMQRDPPPWLTRRTGIEDELAPWVRQHYDAVASTEEFTVWKLRAEAPR